MPLYTIFTSADDNDVEFATLLCMKNVTAQFLLLNIEFCCSCFCGCCSCRSAVTSSCCFYGVRILVVRCHILSCFVELYAKG